MITEKNGPSYRARTVVTLCLLVLYPVVVSSSPVMRTFEDSSYRHEEHGHSRNKLRRWHSPRSLLGERSDGGHEEGQSGPTGAGVDAKEASPVTNPGIWAEKKASSANDDRPSSEGSSDLTAPSGGKESNAHAEAPDHAIHKTERDGAADRSGTLRAPSEESRVSVREDSSSSDEPESKWNAFLSWLGFNSDARHLEDIRESSPKGFHSLHTRRQDVARRERRKRGGFRDKVDPYHDESDATLKDMADYLSEKERSRSLRKGGAQSFDDAPDETPYTGGQDGSYPEAPVKKRQNTEHSMSSSNPMGSIRDSSTGEESSGDWMLDHGGLSDVDVRETVRSFARLFAAIDKRLNGHTDEDIHDTHSHSVRTLYTPEKVRAWNSHSRGHSAWSDPPLRKRWAL